MKPEPATRHPYRSTLRAKQASATRQLILDTATRLFIERGYTATSIDLIAETAGVARSTVFTAAGGKPWLLKTAYDRAIVGDDEQVPMVDRPRIQRLFSMADPAQIVEGYVEVLSEAALRVSRLYEVVRSAAGVDGEVHQLWTEVGSQRLEAANVLATLLKKKGGLRKGLTTAIARDLIWVYNDPGMHYALVEVRGWSQRRYHGWLLETFNHQLLGED
ncbi:helix-turn-helix domain-containing protein [Mycobacterium sp. ITM-2016-00317]|uniref:TetR/AcrR family transcriptional regulator n=1 Tax=Mycobacterium sp. ITM-2016-00317 TaxID=2099694 RepID=UPI000D4D0E1F|nr:helix-turn-helix domain-containing protein [Mycobacterium sp. ITM-2016-00317]WNG86630.1 helix-turn-helix domain-containing protein [Mycobacterium sp. ITM-2016-00317]